MGPVEGGVAIGKVGQDGEEGGGKPRLERPAPTFAAGGEEPGGVRGPIR